MADEEPGEPDMEDSERGWNVEGRPGLKRVYGQEHVIAQVLENGFTVTWTTDDSPADAVEKCTMRDDPDMSAVIRYNENHQVMLSGKDIVPFLRENKCWWVKLTLPEMVDYVVFAAGPPGEVSELASLGPPIEAKKLAGNDPGEQSRIGHLRSMMRKTATDAVRGRLDAVLAEVVGTIST